MKDIRHLMPHHEQKEYKHQEYPKAIKGSNGEHIIVDSIDHEEKVLSSSLVAKKKTAQ